MVGADRRWLTAIAMLALAGKALSEPLGQLAFPVTRTCHHVAAVAHAAVAAGLDRRSPAVLRRVATVRTGWLTTATVAVNTGLVSRRTVRIGQLRAGS